MKIRHLTYFILLNFINQLICYQRISYKFNEVLIQNQYKKLAAGGVVQNISSDLVNSVVVYIPSMAEQTKIANLLNLLDERIATQNKIIEDLKKLKSVIIEKHYSQTEKQIVCVTDLGEPFNVGNLAKDDLAETGMPCVIYGELFTTYG